jgi:TRAP-type C4-dicarboxylate transport system substrate-binding protein
MAFVGFVFNDEDDGLRTMDGPLGAYLRSEAAAKGFYIPRLWWDSAMSEIGSNQHPIVTPDDLRGLKIRVIEGRIFSDLFKVFGASPTVISFGEVYPALQTKLVDAEIAGVASIEFAHWFEVNKYLSLTNHTWSSFMLLVDGNTWKQIPADLQEIIERNNSKYAVIERRDAKLVNAALVDKLARRGMIVNRVDPAPFRAHLDAYYAFWANEFGPTAWGILQTSLGRKIG